MYETTGPLLVFVTQTLHPVLEHHTGYIFAEYDFHYRKPRELFFQHFWEVNVYALHTRAKIELDPERKPATVTALDYILSSELDDSQYDNSGSAGLAGGRPLKGKGPGRSVEPPATELAAWEEDEAKGTGLGVAFPDGEVGDIEYFGE